MTSESDRLESALRAAYATREARPTDDLRSRLDAIPDTASGGTSPARRRFVLALAAAAAAMALVMTPTVIRNVQPPLAPSGSGALTIFDPIDPGAGLVAVTGVSFQGLGDAFGNVFPIVVIVFVIWIVATWLRSLGRPPVPKPPKPRRSRRETIVQALLFILWSLGVAVVLPTFREPPLTGGSVDGPGIGVTEERTDGVTSIELIGNRYANQLGGPRDVYAVGPGQPLTYLVSVRNNWPITIRLDGRLIDSQARTGFDEPNGSTATGLGLLRDPSLRDASVANTTPFTPVDIPAGGEVTVVVAEVGRDCADPTKVVPIRTVSSTGWPLYSDTAPLIEFVYEVFGVQGVDSIVLEREVTVPSNCP